MMPPKPPAEITGVMRSAFVTLAQDKDFIRDYASAVKPIRWSSRAPTRRRSSPRSAR